MLLDEFSFDPLARVTQSVKCLAPAWMAGVYQQRRYFSFHHRV
jgi:hypothetical protein